jgi:hypothetical protein
MLLGGGGGSKDKPAPPKPVQEPAPTAMSPIEPLEATMASEPVVSTDTLDQEAALKQKNLNETKSRPIALSNTGLQIGGMDVKSK